MSILFLITFCIGVNNLKAPLETDFLAIWALFAIADALWVKVLFKK